MGKHNISEAQFATSYYFASSNFISRSFQYESTENLN